MKPLSPLPHTMVSITDTQVPTTVMKVLQQMFPTVDLDGDAYQSHDLWNILVYASATGESIHSVCHRLKGAPSANWLYTTVKQTILEPDELSSLTCRLNKGLEATLPPGLTARRQKVAID